MAFTKAKRLELAAKRFPWSRKEAEVFIGVHDRIQSELEGLSKFMSPLADDDLFDFDGDAKRSKRRLARCISASMGEVGDLVDGIYAKFPDLAPESLRDHYIAR